MVEVSCGGEDEEKRTSLVMKEKVEKGNGDS